MNNKDLLYSTGNYIQYLVITYNGETSLVVQWLRLRASTAGGMGSIPGWGTKILHAVWRGQNKQTTYNGKKSEKE